MSILYEMELSAIPSREVKRASLTFRLLPPFSLSPSVGSSSRDASHIRPSRTVKFIFFLL